MKEILTGAQKLQRLDKTFEALQLLANAPEGKNLWVSIGLGVAEDAGVLFFTNAGLKEIYPDNTSAIVEPSIALVKKYNLNENKLYGLILQLARPKS